MKQGIVEGERSSDRRRVLAGARGAALVAAAFTAHCAPSSPSGVREQLCGGSGCTPQCRDLIVDACDIRERDCQETIFQSVRCVRGTELTTLPSTTFVPQSQLGETPEASDAGQSEGPSEAEVATQVWIDLIDEGLQLLHLTAAPLDQAQAAERPNTGGLATGNSVAIADSSADYEWRSMRLLAHEYVHTMQERDYGGLASLYKRYSRSNVTSQGIQAFIEGEAELYSWLAHAFMRNVSLDSWHLDEFFGVEEKRKRDDVLRAASPWTSARSWQHYAIGARVLYRAWETGHHLAVRSVMYNLEPDFGQWVRDFAPRSGPRVAAEPICNPKGTQVIVQDSLGPSGAYAFLVAAAKARGLKVIAAERAWQIASDVSDDQMRMYAATLGEKDTQTAWLEREAKAAMCGLGSEQKPAPSAADGGKLDGGWDGPDTPQSGACDAGHSQPADTAPTEELPLAELQRSIVPGAPAWVSWEFGFETSGSAKDFEEWVAAAALPALRVEREARVVIVRARRLPTSDGERDAFAAWTCQ